MPGLIKTSIRHRRKRPKKRKVVRDDGSGEGGMLHERKAKKPSEVAAIEAAKKSHEKEMQSYNEIEAEAPFLIRVYKKTPQRVLLSIKELNTNAVYILVVDEDKKAIVWQGADSQIVDRDLAADIVRELYYLDYRIPKPLPDPIIIVENDKHTDTIAQEFDYMRSKFVGSDPNYYMSKKGAATRLLPIANSNLAFGRVKLGTKKYALTGESFFEVDKRGTVPPLDFVEIERDTIFYIRIGSQWDLWIALGASEDAEEAAKMLVAQKILKGLTEEQKAANPSVTTYLRIVRQGHERNIFRRHFKDHRQIDFQPAGHAFVEGDLEGGADGKPPDMTTSWDLFDVLGLRAVMGAAEEEQYSETDALDAEVNFST